MVRPARAPLALALAVAGCGSGGQSGGTVNTPAATPTPTPSPTATSSPSGLLALSGDVSPVHDPTIIKDGSAYFLFVTASVGDPGGLLAMRSSTDLTNWTLRGPVFAAIPAWAQAAVPGTSGLWAPDIVKVNGEYRLYYSVSTFGDNRSAIGLATTNALSVSTPGAGWTDRGPVIQTVPSDNYNAIDPAVFVDADGRHWMAFGSYWTGIKMVELDPATGLRLGSNSTLYSLAARPSPGAVEAAYIVRRDGFYYLFVSFDACCQGSASTYNVVVGRSASPTGPYLDRDERQMLQGGGTQVLASGQGTGTRYVGRGHNAIVNDGTRDYLVYHAYDTTRGGAPTLQIQRLSWDAGGWPVAE